MAGELQMPEITLSQRVIDELADAHLTLEVLVDCSHNQYIQTIRLDRPAQPIITKPIELDTTLKLADPMKISTALGKLQGARSISPLFTIYKKLTDHLPQGFDTLKLRNIKIEFPNFDQTIFSIDTPPPALTKVVAACTARTVEEFMALDDDTRSCMGMYERRNAMSYVQKLPAEPGPRIAAT